LSIHTELIGVVLTGDLLVEQGFSNAGSRLTETGYPVDGVNGQAETVRLVIYSQFQRRIDVSLSFFLYISHYFTVFVWS
jgi:hypothetical protein